MLEMKYSFFSGMAACWYYQQIIISPQYPESNNKPTKKPLWKQAASRPLHSVISQKTELFIATAVSTSNPMYQEINQHTPKSRMTWFIRMCFSNWQELSFPRNSPPFINPRIILHVHKSQPAIEPYHKSRMFSPFLHTLFPIDWS
jgi:hypothetical protein